MLEKIPKISDQLSDRLKVIYSRETYEEILKLLTEQEKRIESLKKDHGLYVNDLEEHKRIYRNTRSETRKHKMDVSEHKVKVSGAGIQGAEERALNFKKQLRVLYNLAHEEALKENDEYNAKKLQATYEQVTYLERSLEHLDPDHIPTSEEQQQMEEKYDKSVRELVDEIAEFFHKNPTNK